MLALVGDLDVELVLYRHGQFERAEAALAEVGEDVGVALERVGLYVELMQDKLEDAGAKAGPVVGVDALQDALRGSCAASAT